MPGSELAFGNGSSCVMTLSGVDHRHAEPREFIVVEVNASAQGASASSDGINAIRCGVGNTGTSSAEGLESRYPFRIESHEIVPDTGGAGQFRGGGAVRRTFHLLQDTRITLAMDRGKFAPAGADGGRPGALASAGVERDGKATRLDTKTSPTVFPAGSRISITSAGGGGVGDPQRREPDALLSDLADGYVTARGAEKHYGARP
jgi:N-methylhydantoinase B